MVNIDMQKIIKDETSITGTYCFYDGGKIPLKGVRVISENIAILITECWHCKIIFVYIKTANINEELKQIVEKYNQGNLSLAEIYNLTHIQFSPLNLAAEYKIDSNTNSYSIYKIKKEDINLTVIEEFLINIGYIKN